MEHTWINALFIILPNWTCFFRKQSAFHTCTPDKTPLCFIQQDTSVPHTCTFISSRSTTQRDRNSIMHAHVHRHVTRLDRFATKLTLRLIISSVVKALLKYKQTSQTRHGKSVRLHLRRLPSGEVISWTSGKAPGAATNKERASAGFSLSLQPARTGGGRVFVW